MKTWKIKPDAKTACAGIIKPRLKACNKSIRILHIIFLEEKEMETSKWMSNQYFNLGYEIINTMVSFAQKHKHSGFLLFNKIDGNIIAL